MIAITWRPGLQASVPAGVCVLTRIRLDGGPDFIRNPVAEALFNSMFRYERKSIIDVPPRDETRK
jgi:hypothetical protein